MTVCIKRGVRSERTARRAAVGRCAVVVRGWLAAAEQVRGRPAFVRGRLSLLPDLVGGGLHGALDVLVELECIHSIPAFDLVRQDDPESLGTRHHAVHEVADGDELLTAEHLHGHSIQLARLGAIERREQFSTDLDEFTLSQCLGHGASPVWVVRQRLTIQYNLAFVKQANISYNEFTE